MWLLFQATILFAVIAANFFLHITPNPYLVGVCGVLLAQAPFAPRRPESIQ